MPPLISIDTNGANRNKIPTNSVRSNKKNSRIRNFIFRKIFTEDDAYADGEYEKNDDSIGTVDTTYTTINKPKGERETWSGKFDVKRISFFLVYYYN